MTRLYIARHVAAVKLRKHELTVDEGVKIQDAADASRRLLDQAISTCAQDQRTGKCTGSTSFADALLGQAQQAAP